MIKNAIIIFFKEIKCIFRDRKTFFISLVLPLILAPCMLFMTELSVSMSENSVKKNLTVAFSNKNNSFYKFCMHQKNIVIKDVSDEKSALEKEEILVYLKIPDDMDMYVFLDKSFDIEIKYNESSINSVMAMAAISDYELAYKTIITQNDFNDSDELERLISKEVSIPSMSEFKGAKDTSLYFEILTPVMILIYCCVGSFSTASEISVGEKERGTWEPLLATGVKRESIVIGKLMASVLMGTMSVGLTIIGLFLYLIFSVGFSSTKVSILGVFLLFLISMFMTLFISTVSIAVGMYSKSSKETQIYFMPISMLVVSPSFFLTSIDIGSIGWVKLSIPIYNVVCVMKELLNNVFIWWHIGVIISWLLIYSAIFFEITLKSLKKESILFRA